MADKKLILLVDDHPLFRHGLKSLIAESFPAFAVAEAGSVGESRALMDRISPDIIILDVTLPDGDGISFAGEYLAKHTKSRIYILTMHRRSGLLKKAREAGCRGYFLKEGDGGALVNAIESNLPEFQVSPQLRELLESTDRESETLDNYAHLTRREKELFRLFAEGLGYKEIAWMLNISPRTASVHRYNIFQKLNISSEVELVKVAREAGILI